MPGPAAAFLLRYGHMRYHLASRLAAAMFLFSLAAPALAAPSEDWISDEQEKLLTAFAAHLTDDAGLFAIRAELKPPRTTFTVDFSPKFQQETKADVEALRKEIVHVRAFVDTRPAFEGHPAGSGQWTADISCGTFKTGFENSFAFWEHPEGPPPDGCRHEDGTSHRGTIAFEGTVWVLAAQYDNYDGIERSTGPEMLSAMWRVRCTYEGSETGTGPTCEQTLVHWDGLEGVGSLATPPAESVLDDVDTPPEPKPGTWAAYFAAAAALAAATGWALHRWGQKARLDPKGGREEPERRSDRW